MISSLSIKNYALIDDIQVPLTKGLTIITGETGAGKSRSFHLIDCQHSTFNEGCLFESARRIDASYGD